MSSKRKWVTCGFEFPIWNLWFLMTLAGIHTPAIWAFMMRLLLCTVRSIFHWSGMHTYGRSPSNSSAYFHKTCRNQISLASLPWYKIRFILAIVLLGTYAGTEGVIICVISLGNCPKPRAQQYFYCFPGLTSWMEFCQRAPSRNLS